MLIKGIYTFAFLFFLFSPSYAASDSMLKGDAAYDKGHYNEASEFYKKAAEQGNAEAQNRLGLMYHNGEGVPQDHAEAEKWFRKSANQGNEEAKLNLHYSYNKENDGRSTVADVQQKVPTETVKKTTVKKVSNKKQKTKKKRRKQA